MAEWVLYRLIERPYWNERGQLLSSIAGLRNRKGIDGFCGGGKLYPDTGKLKILERYEKGTVLLLLVDGEAGEILDLAAKSQTLTYKASPVVTRAYDHKDFAGKVISAEEAELLLRDMGIAQNKETESGVTK